MSIIAHLRAFEIGLSAYPTAGSVTRSRVLAVQQLLGGAPERLVKQRDFSVQLVQVALQRLRHGEGWGEAEVKTAGVRTTHPTVLVIRPIGLSRRSGARGAFSDAVSLAARRRAILALGWSPRNRQPRCQGP